MNTNANTSEPIKRNPNISKWNILFEREGKQWMSIRPQEGTEVYTCYACREIFGSKTSFLDHVNRFTIVLNFKCNMCSPPVELQFYNPCALLLHSRQHYTPFGGHICLDDMKVSCLPLGLVGFPPHHEIPMIYDVKDDDANGLNINTRFYAPAKIYKGKNLVSMVPTILLFYHYRLNGAPPASLVLKQICTNIPKCVFTKLETASVTTNIVNPVNEKRIVHTEVAINNNNIVNDVSHTEVNVTNGIDSEDSVNIQNSTLETPENIVNGNEEANQGNNIVEINENVREENIENNIEQVRIKEELSDEGSEENEMCAQNPLAIPNVNVRPPGVCSECNTDIVDAKVMSHFSGMHPLSDDYQCDICKYIAASPCSFSAHKRLHVREPPFICPECGKEFEMNIDLLDHLDDVCFHLAKQVRLRCPKKNCCKVFAQMTTFMIHFEVHIQTLNKCTVCSAMFYAVRDHLEHSETEHSEVVPSDIIYKCTICKNSTLHSEHYKHHIQWHCSDDSLRVYVYICKFCRNFFRSATTYANHLLRCSKKDLTIEELRRLKKSNAAIVCLHCNYAIRLITKLDDCPRCGNSINGRTITPYLIKKPPEINTVLPKTIKCILCFEDLIFNEAQSHECKYKYPKIVLIKDDENIQKILNMKHEVQETSSKNDFTPKRKRRKTSTSPIHSKQKRSTGIHGHTEPHLDEPVPFEGTYECRLCEFKNNNRTTFHDHIKNHRNVSTAYQCMECGDCFVVKPSFHKHLLYYHKIVNVDEYVKENECVDESAISELKKHMRIESGEINDDVAENQCKVCLKQFKDPLELNKHFRMHGMAFLRNNK